MSAAAENSNKGAEDSVPVWRQRTSPLMLGLLGSGLMWLAFPPVDAWPLAWVATIPWLMLIRRKNIAAPSKTVEQATSPTAGTNPSLAKKNKQSNKESDKTSEKLGFFKRSWRFARQGWDFSRPYVALWWAGFAFWLAAIHWLRYPHPMTHFGWLALSAYLAFYLPLFISISRAAVHTLQVPLILAAPLVWTGLELLRAHLLTGFLMAALGHTQYQWMELIQISDLGGAYLVSFLVLFVTACLTRMLPHAGERFATWPVIPLSLSLMATLIYGYQRTAQPLSKAGPSVALIQGAIAPDWKHDPKRAEKILEHYLDLSRKALKENVERPVDLLVWPETMYRQTIVEVDSGYPGTPEELRAYRLHLLAVKSDLATIATRLKTPLLFGIDAIHFTPEGQRFHNAAVFVSRAGELLDRYDKMHRVMFGEYIPLAEYIPFLYQATPLTGGIAPGESPKSVEVEGTRFSPNICFETVVPHVIRKQILSAQAEGKAPDVLVNLTNDAWFRGSSELDMHLACGVFRAIECRKPLLIAANEGISASIDSNGNVVHQLPKRAAGYLLLTDLALDTRTSLYLKFGDWPAGFCFGMTLLFGAIGLGKHIRKATPAS